MKAKLALAGLAVLAMTFGMQGALAEDVTITGAGSVRQTNTEEGTLVCWKQLAVNLKTLGDEFAINTVLTGFSLEDPADPDDAADPANVPTEPACAIGTQAMTFASRAVESQCVEGEGYGDGPAELDIEDPPTGPTVYTVTYEPTYCDGIKRRDQQTLTVRDGDIGYKRTWGTWNQAQGRYDITETWQGTIARKS